MNITQSAPSCPAGQHHVPHLPCVRREEQVAYDALKKQMVFYQHTLSAAGLRKAAAGGAGGAELTPALSFRGAERPEMQGGRPGGWALRAWARPGCSMHGVVEWPHLWSPWPEALAARPACPHHPPFFTAGVNPALALLRGQNNPEIRFWETLGAVGCPPS